jgi:hypothetical protein
MGEPISFDKTGRTKPLLDLETLKPAVPTAVCVSFASLLAWFKKTWSVWIK